MTERTSPRVPPGAVRVDTFPSHLYSQSMAKDNHPRGGATGMGWNDAWMGRGWTSTLAATEWGTTHLVQPTRLVEWENPHGATFTDWTADCGRTGTASGWVSRNTCSSLASAGHAVRAMMCKECMS